MKVFGRWLVKTVINDHIQIVSSFMTKKDAVEALSFRRTKKSDNLWIDQLGQQFWIEKNTKEYN